MEEGHDIVVTEQCRMARRGLRPVAQDCGDRHAVWIIGDAIRDQRPVRKMFELAGPWKEIEIGVADELVRLAVGNAVLQDLR